MTVKRVTTLTCNRCSHEIEWDFDDKPSGPADWILFGGVIIRNDHGGSDHPSAYEADLCPSCAIEFNTWWSKMGNG